MSMTGYVHIAIDKDLNLKQWLPYVARAFGACVTMRDDSIDIPAPEKIERRTDSLYVESLKIAKAKIIELEAMTDEEKIKYGQERAKENLAYLNKSFVKSSEIQKKLDALMEEVVAWEPPTEEHKGVKDFMIEQLTSSSQAWYLKHHTDEIQRIVNKPFLEYYEDALELARNDISYYEKKIQEDNEREDGRNEWLQQLWASIKAMK